MNLEKEISNLQNHELFVAYEEIEELKETGILRSGIVRETTHKFANFVNESPSQFLKLVEDKLIPEHGV